MAKLFKNLESKVSNLIEGIQKTYSQEEEPEYLTPDDHRKLKTAADIFLIVSAVVSGTAAAYTKDLLTKVLCYSVSGAVATSYILSKVLSYKMKKQDENKKYEMVCGHPDCKYEKNNAEKIYKKDGIKHEPFNGPCIAFKPEHMMLNCIKYKKYGEK